MKTILDAMKSKNGMFRVLFMAVGCLALSSGALFAEMEGEVEVTGQGIRGNSDSSKFTEYRTVPEGVYVEKLSVKTEHEKTDCYLDVRASKPGLDDQNFLLSGGKRGTMKFNLGYDQTLHNYTNNAKSFYVHDGNGNMRLSDALQGVNVLAGGATNFADVPGIPVVNRRDKLTSSLSFSLPRGLGLNLAFSNEDQNGSKVRGIYDGTTSSPFEVAEPIRYNTRDVSASLDYADKTFSTAFSYSGSFFKNSIHELIADSYATLNDGTPAASGASSTGREGVALAPDNQSHNISLAGGANLPFWESRLNASVSYGWMSQNDTFVPMTVNQQVINRASALGVNINPSRSSFDGKLKTFSANSSLALKPFNPLTVTGRVRYYKLTNESPELTHSYVLYDNAWSTSAPVDKGFNPARKRTNLNIEYSKLNSGADVSYLLLSDLDMTVKYDWEKMKRHLRDAPETNEHTLTASLNYMPKKWVTLRPKYVHANRYHKSYDEEEAMAKTFPLTEGYNALGTSGDMRRFDEANRLRDVIGANAFIYPLDNLSIGTEYLYRVDDYNGTDLGTQKERNQSVAVDVNYDMSEDFAFFGSYSREENITDIKNRYRESGNATRLAYDYPANDWQGKADDTTDTFGVGAKAAVIKKKLDMDASYEFSRSRGQLLAANLNPIVVNGAQGGGNATSQLAAAKAIDFPETKTESHNASVAFKWHMLENVAMKLGYNYERYLETDFSIDTIDPWEAAWPGGVFLNSHQGSYDVHIVALSLIYKFGG